MKEILASTEWIYLMRILIACLCGALIGLEREKRSKNAGVRTHILVSLASALMMIVSKYGFFDVIVTEGITIDASRIAAGVVTAIGFLGAGVIFIRNENTIGLTTAAGLWCTVGIGITIGSGMYITGISATVLIIVLQYLLHAKFLHAAAVQITGKLVISLKDRTFNIPALYSFFRSRNIGVKTISLTEKDDQLELVAFLVFRGRESIEEDMGKLKELGRLVSIEIAAAP